VKIASISFTDDAETAYLYVYNDKAFEEEILRIMVFNRDYMAYSEMASDKIPPRGFTVIKIKSKDMSSFIGHFTSFRVEGDREVDEVGLRIFPTYFPIGSYGGAEILSDKHNTMEALELGFDTVVAPVKDVEEAKKHGLRVIAYTPYEENRLDVDLFEKYVEDKGVLAWYIIDEPDIWVERGKVSEQWVIRQIREVYRRDKLHPTYIVLCRPFIFEKYARYPDVLAVDPYPICVLPLSHVSFMVDRAIETAIPKPVWLIPQAFRHGMPKPNGSWGWKRFPRPDEERLMVYMGISHGAKGVIYFTYGSHMFNANDPVEGLVSRHPDAVQLKRGIARLSGELHTLGELLRYGYRVTGPCLRHSYSSNGAVEINEIFVRDDTLIVLLVNHDYVSTVDGFSINEKNDVDVSIVVPEWFSFEDSFIVDYDGLSDIKVVGEGNRVSFKVDSIREAKAIVLTGDGKLFRKMNDKYKVWRRI